MTNLFNKKNLGVMVGVLIIVLLFILTSYIANIYESQIELFIEGGNGLDKVVYVCITVIATVIAPVSVMPLIPLASHLWGWIIAGLLSIIGWVIGAQIAFIVARKFGKPIVAKLISMERLNVFEHYFTSKNLFWFVVLLRMILPVDLLSYALGLFSKMEEGKYFLATLIGITPFAFIFSYTGVLPIKSQALIFLVVAVIIGIIYFVGNNIKKKK